MEKVAEARVIIVHETCPECEVGLMKVDYTLPVLSTYPPQYGHRCSNCGFITHYTMQYPYHKLIPIEPLREMREDEKQ